MIKDRNPGAPEVLRFPHPAIHLAHVEDVRLTGNAGDRARAASTKGTNHPPVQILINIFWNLLCLNRFHRNNREECKDKDKDKDEDECATDRLASCHWAPCNKRLHSIN